MEKVLQKWLDHQCRMLQGSRRALLVIGKTRKGTFKRTLYWPDDNYDYAEFNRIAQLALQNNKAVFKTLRNQDKNSDQSLSVLACPIFLKKKLLGAVVIALAYRSLSLQNAAVQQVQNGVRWLEAMLELPYDPLQAAKTKLFGLRRPSLQTAVGLTTVLLVGLILVNLMLRMPSNRETEEVTRRTIVVPKQIHTIKDQAHLGDGAGNGVTVTAEIDQSPPRQDSKLDPKRNTISAESQHVEVVAALDVTGSKSDPVIAPDIPDGVHTATAEHQALESESKPIPPETKSDIYSIEIGPITKASQLKQATQFLQTNGYQFQQTSGAGTIKVIRLLEGLYTRASVKERFKTVQKVVNSAFIVKENGKRAIYVATYHDSAKANQRIKQLAQKDIQVTTIDAELKMEGPIFVLKNMDQSNTEAIRNQMSDIGLSVEVSKSK